jgi:signal peptidase
MAGRFDGTAPSAGFSEAPYQAPARRVAAGAARRGFDAMLAAIAVAALMPALLPLVGYRTFVVQSGSMSPALKTGDVIVSRLVAPSSIRAKEIVTLSQGGGADVPITHRVVEMSRQGDRYSILTKGDRNTVVEKWSVREGGEIPRVVFRVPKLGFAVAGVSTPGARFLLAGAFFVLATVAISRKVWL